MNYLDLEDRLYTSTEVARILGVSLRSVYRYLEDGKLDAEIKTATGRHRFTKQNILEFLSPQASRKNTETVESSVVSRSSVSDIEGDFTPIKSRQAFAEKLTPIVEDDDDDANEVEDTNFYAEPESKVASSGIEEESTFKPTSFEDDTDDEFVVSTRNTHTEVEATMSSVQENEEEVDWLAKFRAAAEKYKAEVKAAEEETSVPAYSEPIVKREDSVSVISQEPMVEERPETKSNVYYFTSTVGGLKDIAQNLDKSAQKASLDYAFTMDAGLSLHKPIRPFSLIHSYVRSEDLPFFEKILGLKNADKEDAQLCLIISDDDELFSSSKEMHGLKVVSNSQLRADLTSEGKADLAKEL